MDRKTPWYVCLFLQTIDVKPEDISEPGTKGKQIKMEQFVSHVNRWAANDHRTLAADRKLTEMICLDMQPMSMVEDTGFKTFVDTLQPSYSLPTRKHLRWNLIPKLYNEIKANIKQQLEMVEIVSITTDHWTSRANDAYMSVTAHILTEDFELKDFCLDVAYMPQSHNAENISRALVDSVKSWIPGAGTNKEVKIYVVSDNAANIQAACRLLPDNYRALNCFAHTLQLVIKDGLKEFTGAQNVISKCQNIVNHFHHSAKSTHMLKGMQKTMQMPDHN
ncbi:zinc finger BED domain-containing protein 4-like [Gigantopelta aegis]|uniref:zinc finger BED domain-containing protein 4-like n=1 Tax=Gigantopelta aegis TaxID=1735272 RepID=UPI001B888BDC|nr:zinc finger BED domain-containing protein 4-like [Gigantopelta aegis]